MASLIRYIVLAGLVSTSLASAQIRCRATATPSLVRAEGTAELLGDLILTCTGGTPASTNNFVPRYELLLTSNAPFSSRAAVAGATAATDALLLVDEPRAFEQVACAPAPGADGCSRTPADQGPNVFPGLQVQDNLVAFSSIPLDEPGPDRTRLIRITNLRANIPALRAATGGSQVQLSIQLYANGRSIPVDGQNVVLADARPAYTFLVRTATDGAVADLAPAVLTSPTGLPANSPRSAPTFNIKFREGFATAFRRRNLGTSGADPTFSAPQAVPGLRYNTESGFYNPGLIFSGGSSTTGLADSGTRLRLVFKNVPKNVALWVSTRDVQPGTTGYSLLNQKAVLTESDANGSGPFTATAPRLLGYAQLGVSADGYATAVWEITSTDPEAIEDISFSVALSSSDGAAALGSASVTGSLSPNADGEAGSAAAMVPSFRGTSAPLVAFTLAPGGQNPQVAVVSAASFDTAVAPGSIATIFGTGLAATTAAANGALPTALADTSVDIIDAAGVRRAAGLFLVTPGQVNFLLDPTIRPGPAVVNVMRGTKIAATGVTNVERIAPGLFSLNSQGGGPAVGESLHIGSTNESSSLSGWDPEQKRYVLFPLDLGPDADLVYLVLYGTGLRGATNLSDFSARIADLPVPVIFAGAQASSPGLDQVNIGPLPRALKGKGEVDIALKVAGKEANRVTVSVR